MMTFKSNKKLRSPCLSMAIVILSMTMLFMAPMDVTCESAQYTQSYDCPFQKSFIMMTKTRKHFFSSKNVPMNESKRSSSCATTSSDFPYGAYTKSSVNSNSNLDKKEEKILVKQHRVGWLSINSYISGNAYNSKTAKKEAESEDSLLSRLINVSGGSFSVESEAEYDDDDDVEEGNDNEEEEADESEVEEEDLEESDEEYDIEEEGDEDEYDMEEEESDDSEVAIDEELEYDTMLMPSSMQSMGVTLGVMLATRNLDLNDAKIVKYARYGYLAYVIVSQIFFAYVRIQAKLIHDTTIITISNPLTKLVKNQLNTALGSSDKSNNDTGMAKTLTDKFLSSSSTVMDYDINQSRKLMSGMFFSLAFMWFLHFKMNQVQPLLYQTASGVLNLVYSPLFQVYILGRNLERPFKPPIPAIMGNDDATDEDSADVADVDADADANEQSIEEDQLDKDDNVDENDEEKSDDDEDEDNDVEDNFNDEIEE